MTERADQVRALVERGDHRLAWAELSRMMMERPTTATCHVVADLAQRIDAAAADVVTTRLAVLSNYTAEPLVPLLQARAVTSGVQLVVHLPAFDTWMQELVGEGSDLRRFDPEIVIVDLHPHALCPGLYREFLGLTAADVAAIVRDTAGRIEEAVRSLRSWSQARVLVHSFARPVTPSLGILDSGDRSQGAAIAALNARIQQITADARDVWCLDTDRLVAEIGDRNFHDQRLWLLAKIPYTPAAMHRIAEEHLRYVRAFTGRSRKVLALDLDDTLWGGVLGERGSDGIDLGPTYPGNAFVDVQTAVLEWQRRGVVLALNSSNDADEAVRVLDSHPAMRLRSTAFAAARINWQDKAQNLVELAGDLGLGLDSFVFVDNSAAECARVRQALPEVLTVHLDGDPSSFAATLRGLAVFDSLSYTAEDRQRGSWYRAEALRTALQQTIGSLDEYLASLGTELTIEPVGASTAARAADLTQRTNQFNMTGRRRTRDEIAAYADTPQHDAYVFALRDRFGDQGIVGFATLEAVDGAEVRIADFLVSCRVLKRRVEQTMLAFLLERARERGASRIVGEFRPTKRNAAFSGFYDAAGFQPGSAAGDVQQFVRSPGGLPDAPTYVRVVRRPALPTKV